MFPLPNGCMRSEISVSPANWHTVKAKIKKPWKIYYRFYDPDYKGTKDWGKQISVKGMNVVSELKARQKSTRDLIDDVIRELELEGFNPITGNYLPPEGSSARMINPFSPLREALDVAFERLDIGKDARETMGYALVNMKNALQDLRFDKMAVSQVEPRHIIFWLDKIGENKYKAAEKSDKPPRAGTEIWSASNYNHHRAYMMMLFRALVPLGAVKVNPVREVPLKRGIKKKKVIFNREERMSVAQLREMRGSYTFWRFIQIFFHSGARISEMMRIRKEHVDLKSQTIDTVIYKGRQYLEEDKVIKDIVVPLWRELMNEAAPGDFLFSKDLRPGPVKISARQITIRWRRVRGKLGINKTIYKLKHTHSTEVMGILVNMFKDAREKVAKHNNHKGTDMLQRVYDVESEQRESWEIMHINNAL